MIVLLGGPADGTLLDHSPYGPPKGWLGTVHWHGQGEPETYYGSFKENDNDYYIHWSEAKDKVNY